MKLRRINKPMAFTLPELAVALCVVVGLVFLFAPLLSTNKIKGHPIHCASRLRQVGVAFRMFSNDNDDRFPYATTNSLAYQNSSNAWVHFQVLSNELGYRTRTLVCPLDTNRFSNVAADFSANQSGFQHVTKQDLALSYFVGLSADETKSNAILSGDRNLASESTLPAYSSHQMGGAVKADLSSRWSIHPGNQLHGDAGNLLFADGSVQMTDNEMLEDYLRKSVAVHGSNENWFLFPQ